MSPLELVGLFGKLAGSSPDCFVLSERLLIAVAVLLAAPRLIEELLERT